MLSPIPSHPITQKHGPSSRGSSISLRTTKLSTAPSTRKIVEQLCITMFGRPFWRNHTSGILNCIIKGLLCFQVTRINGLCSSNSKTWLWFLCTGFSFFEWCYIAEGQLAGRKVYVGGLLEEVKKEDIMRVFDHFGTIDDVWVARNPYAFITIFKLIFLL